MKPFATKRVESVRAQLAGERQGYVIWTLAPPSAPPSISSNTGQRTLAIKPNSFEAQYALANAQAARATKVAPGPLNAGKVAGEILAGMGGGFVIGIVGAGIGMKLTGGDYLGFLLGFAIGSSVGSSRGVYWVGNIGDETGSYVATLGGSLLGGAVVVVGAIATWEVDWGFIPLLAAPAIGAVIGFNATRKKKSPLESRDALLNFNEGKMCLVFPSISLRLRHRRELIQRVDLVKASF